MWYGTPSPSSRLKELDVARQSDYCTVSRTVVLSCFQKFLFLNASFVWKGARNMSPRELQRRQSAVGKSRLMAIVAWWCCLEPADGFTQSMRKYAISLLGLVSPLGVPYCIYWFYLAFSSDNSLRNRGAPSNPSGVWGENAPLVFICPFIQKRKGIISNPKNFGSRPTI